MNRNSVVFRRDVVGGRCRRIAGRGGGAGAGEARRAGEGLRRREDAVGRSRHLGRVDERRRHRHPDAAARSVRRPRRAERRGVRRQAETRRADARARGKRDRIVPERQRLARQVVPPDVAHHRPAGRQAAGRHAVRRIAPRDARSGHVRRRSLRPDGRLHELRPVHHARHHRVDSAGRVRQRQPDHAGARPGDHQLRDGARHARHLHGRPAAPRQGHPPAARGFARALGGQHARRSRRRT